MLTIIAHHNNEIEVRLSRGHHTQRHDRPVPRHGVPDLDIKRPVHTRKVSRLKSGLVAGFGRLHRGKGRFRRGVKRRVQRLGGALDFYWQKHGGVRGFLTLTCPGSSRRATEAFSAWSGYILDTLNKWISEKIFRATGERGFPRLHTWELQKRGAEHLHYAFCCSRSVYEDIEKELKSWWNDLLIRVSGLASVDIFERESGKGSWRGRLEVLQAKLVEVNRSISAYLSKYLSKGLNARARGFSGNSVPRPARLWGVSRFLVKFQKRCTTSHSFVAGEKEEVELLSVFLAHLESLPGRLCSHIWRSGLMIRVRFFPSLSQLDCDEIVTSLLPLLEGLEGSVPKGSSSVRKYMEYYKKAQRISANNKKRVAFDDIYGNEASKLLAAYVIRQVGSGFEYQILFSCLEDFDEVALASSAKLPPTGKKDKIGIQQLALRLFPPRS